MLQTKDHVVLPPFFFSLAKQEVLVAFWLHSDGEPVMSLKIVGDKIVKYTIVV